MATTPTEEKFKSLLDEIILIINREPLLRQNQISSQCLSEDDVTLDVDIHTISFNRDDEQRMTELTRQIEIPLGKVLPQLDDGFRRFLLNCLFEYSYDDEKFRFKEFLGMQHFGLLLNDLQATRDAPDAFRAAKTGNRHCVAAFLDQFPTFKDKPGPWGTTLLFSAARNNQMEIVKYLLREKNCSVDAQNRQHLQRALRLDTITASDYTVDPSAGSTALHGACYGGHLDIVKELIEYGANYFIRNQVEETPIMNAITWPTIIEYFETLLNRGYVEEQKNLPENPIKAMEEKSRKDCVWELLAFNSNQQWLPFDKSEERQLNELMMVADGKSFRTEYQWSINRTTDMIRFLLSGSFFAWIRCRGSPILNFDCFAFWQIFYLKHPNGEKDRENEMPMKILDLSLVDENEPKIQLNTWYHCDADSNHRLDEAMNNRRKHIKFVLFDSPIRFDLMNFTFSNENQSIFGYLRWIPKLVTTDEQNKHRIIQIDHFQASSSISLIPLTTKNGKEISQSKRNQKTFDFDDDELSIDDEIDIIDDEQVKHACSVDTDQEENQLSHDLLSMKINSFDDGTELNVNTCINDDQANQNASEQLSRAEKSISTEGTAELRQKINELEEDIAIESSKIQSISDIMETSSHDSRQELEQINSSCLQQIKRLTTKLNELKRRQEILEQVKQEVQINEYNGIPKEVVHDFLLPKFQYFVSQLRATVPDIDGISLDKFLTIDIKEVDGTYQFQLKGFPKHHAAFKVKLKRILTLANCQTSSIEYYERHTNRILRSISQNLLNVNVRTKSWRQYMKILERLLHEKRDLYRINFDRYIRSKASSLTERAIDDPSMSPSNELRQSTNTFIETNPLTNELEELKYHAMEEFIEQNFTSRIIHLEQRRRPSSVRTLNIFLDRIKNELKTNPDFVGHEIRHFKLIPDLLKRCLIYYSCFMLQLPLFDESTKLLDMIQANTVTTIATSTGSGKSTLLPALLIAEGYDKVLVTQPRRFPCTSISSRVNDTIKSDIEDAPEQLAGWAISGDGSHQNAPIIYVTDGLLRERLLNNENLISLQTKVEKATVFFIDEVHERSINIDLCLALLARLLTNQPNLRTKLKLIISSATLDSSVPQLFQRIPGIRLSQFQSPQIGLLHNVRKIFRPKENILDIVQELFKKRRRNDQILCFVNSVTEVHQCCRVLEELTQGTIKGYPLIQSQTAAEQRSYIERGSVFFSTTVAETSLTFPSLKYVVDTGMINIPVYEPKKRRTVMKEIRAAESTIKQRLGRLGRTQDGEYYALYDFQVEDQRFPIPQICQLDLSNLEFSLRRSPIRRGFHYMEQFLPDKPERVSLDAAVEELVTLNVLEKTPMGEGKFTKHGQNLAQLPDFGSVAMSKAVLAALTQYHCGHDLICLSAILGSLNTSIILKDIPPTMKSADGDFMTLLKVMNEILLVKQSSGAKDFNLKIVCQHKGLERIQHHLRQALTRYANLEKIFNNSRQFRQQAQIQSDDWKLIARALLEGYADNIFVSMKELQGRTHQFGRYTDTEDIAVLDLQSTLTRDIKQAPVRLVLARDVVYSSAARSTAVISFVGEIKASWCQRELLRHLVLSPEEKQHLESHNIFQRIASIVASSVKLVRNKIVLVLKKETGAVFNDELELRKHLVTTKTFQLQNDCKQGTAEHENLARNLKEVSKRVYIFHPMCWRWEAERQMKITVDTNPAAETCVVKVEGRLCEQENVRNEFKQFEVWLRRCVVIRHPNSGVPPRLLHLRLRKKYPYIEKNIARITNVDRTLVDLYKAVKDKKATRESRMEVVAWIAVCEFHCKLEGGFVRDWVISNEPHVPANLKNNSKDWIEYQKNADGNNIPGIKKGIIPSDLDCHLPLDRRFDIEKFQDRLHKFGFVCKVFREDWRYVVLIDEDAPTGPFTMDLIEPHVALTHDRIDLDVSNLSLERNYPREIGMRIDVTQSPYSIELESIVENIIERRFRVLRPIDQFVRDRIEKMTQRGWTQKGEPINVNPSPPPKCCSLLVPIPSTSLLYESLANEMKKININIRIVAIEQVRNPLLEDTYEAIKKMIAKECPGSNPNERKLFHGTDPTGVKGITENGFDDRFFNPNGAWGAGAYFADDPRKSHQYADEDGSNKNRVMFYSKVTLGKESIQGQINQSLVAAPQGYHSVRGTHFQFTEYIVYRFGQALPYFKVTYKA